MWRLVTFKKKFLTPFGDLIYKTFQIKQALKCYASNAFVVLHYVTKLKLLVLKKIIQSKYMYTTPQIQTNILTPCPKKGTLEPFAKKYLYIQLSKGVHLINIADIYKIVINRHIQSYKC